jgi:hypothetical protein
VGVSVESFEIAVVGDCVSVVASLQLEREKGGKGRNARSEMLRTPFSAAVAMRVFPLLVCIDVVSRISRPCRGGRRTAGGADEAAEEKGEGEVERCSCRGRG